MGQSPVKEHFDNISASYDYFKEKNWYYYQSLKVLYKRLIPAGKFVLEVGCGTGDLISDLEASKAVGIDISPGMIEIAQEKHPEILFEATVIEKFKPGIGLDYIFLADVLEHLEDIPSMIVALRKICRPKTKIIFTYANPLWEPVLLLLEKMRLKMPEGPHYRIPFRKFKNILSSSGFQVEERGWRLLFPAHIKGFSWLINSFFYHIPGLRRLGLVEYLILKPI